MAKKRKTKFQVEKGKDSGNRFNFSEFYCYICGYPLGTYLLLFSLKRRTDRVFLVHETCAKQSRDPAFIVGVTRTTRC